MSCAHESHTRSVAKGVTWRVIASLTTMGLVYYYTKNLVLVAEVGALEVFLKLLFYYLHERVWGKVAWGKVNVSRETEKVPWGAR